MDEKINKLDVLRQQLALGAEQAKKGEFIENYSIQEIIRELDRDATTS